MKKRIIGAILVFMCIMAVAVLFYINSHKLPYYIQYSAENSFITIEIHNVKDAEIFEKIKPKDMSITNSLKEMQERGDRFILGLVHMYDYYYNEDVQYELLIEREDGTTILQPVLVAQWTINNGEAEASFFLSEPDGVIYKSLTLFEDGKETVKFELKQK